MNDPEHQSQREQANHQVLISRPEEALRSWQHRWLEPLGLPGRLLQRLLYYLNRGAMRCLFRLEVRGLEQLPLEPPFILAPAHTSSLDPFAIAAAMPYRELCQTYWAGRREAVTANLVRRAISRVMQVVPIEQEARSLAAAAVVLRRKQNLVWFPEGKRSLSGELQPFKMGIGVLLKLLDVPAVPVYIHGARQAAPPPRHRPRRLTRISVFFGRALRASDLVLPQNEEEAYEQIANELHARVAELKQALTGRGE